MLGAGDGGHKSDQLPEFFHSQSSLSNDGAERSFGHFTMVGHGQASMWRSAMWLPRWWSTT